MARQQNQVRIIGGRLRSRKLSVPDLSGLRPTPDRIRETLFNWLNSISAQSNVLDCFAGSGALGIEAASRGTKNVVLVEKDRTAAINLKMQIDTLESNLAEVINDDILVYLENCSRVFDIVFVDPPYRLPELRDQVLNKLIERSLINEDSLIYLEWPTHDSTYTLPDQFVWIKRKRAGQVEYGIAQVVRNR
ncbi:MAG: 16S rRNA (guanine966-N2)-methyltransferase [Gammaproteobacteria bacterium]|jgi:16S rRNA (guanine966-N2)-methyltransferase